jgi:thiol:disulfide interchange protein DsbD
MTRMLLFLGLVLGLSSSAQARDAANPFRVEAESLQLSPGSAGALRITIAVPKDHHLYKDMVEVVVLESGGLKLGPASMPVGLKKPDPADPSTTREVYDMNVIIEVPVAPVTAAGKYPLTFSITYQGCKKSLCWMPQTDEVRAIVRVK